MITSNSFRIGRATAVVVAMVLAGLLVSLAGTSFASPGWSPDGTRITFTTDEEGGNDVYVMPANGTGQKRLTVNGVPTDSSPVFSPDGSKIAFQTNRDGNFEIYAMDRDGAAQTNLTNDPAGDFTPDWQPARVQH